MNGITVLVVEDHTIVRQGIVSLINNEDDITVVGEACDGRQAIAQCKEKNPSIVIMDLAMPRLNGLDATRVISKEFPHIKIIVLTMYSEEEYILKAIDAGVSGYLIKKNAAEDLIRAIRVVSDGKAFFSPVISRTVLDSYYSMAEKVGAVDGSRKNHLISRKGEVLQLMAEGNVSKDISEKNN